MPNPSSDKPNTDTHPLVAKLQGDSDAPPKLVALTGYFGPSKKADAVRLYLGLDFQSYVEIPRAAIVATTPADAKDDTSPTIVHVKAGTHVDAVHASTQPVEAYLQGGITGGYLGNVSPSPEVMGGGPTIGCSHQICRPLPQIAAMDLNPQPLPPGVVLPTPTAVPTHPVLCTHVGCLHPTPTAVPTYPVFCPQVGGVAPDFSKTHSPVCYLTNAQRGGRPC